MKINISYIKHYYILIILFSLSFIGCFDNKKEDNNEIILSYPDFYPEYSSDGKSFIFNAQYKYINKIFILDKETGDIRIFHDKNSVLERVYVPSFSKDGKYITFSKYFKNTKTYEVFMMKSDGMDIKQISKNHQISYIPIFSNDGKYIYFGMKPDIKHTYQWHKIEINTLEQTKISNDDFIAGTNVSVSSDDRYLIFNDVDMSKIDTDENDYLADKIVKLDLVKGKMDYIMFGNHITPLINKENIIIFSGNQLNKRNFYGKDYPAFEKGIYKINLNGNNMTKLLSDKDINQLLNSNGSSDEDYFDTKTFRLSPDEKYFFFESAHGNFYEISLDGKDKRQIIFDKEKIKKLFKEIYTEEDFKIMNE